MTLDEKIATLIFNKPHWTPLRYSRDIEAAWLVVNVLHTRGWWFSLERLPDETWQAGFEKNGFYMAACDKTAAEAICKAAVKVGMRARSEHCSAGS